MQIRQKRIGFLWFKIRRKLCIEISSLDNLYRTAEYAVSIAVSKCTIIVNFASPWHQPQEAARTTSTKVSDPLTVKGRV